MGHVGSSVVLQGSTKAFVQWQMTAACRMFKLHAAWTVNAIEQSSGSTSQGSKKVSNFKVSTQNQNSNS